MGNLEQREALDSEHLDKGIRLAFGLASQQAGESVLDALERVTGTRSKVSLPGPAGERDPILRIPGKNEHDEIQDDHRYQVIGEIARGGVGVVYHGRDRDLGRDVAIKVLRSDRVGSPEVVQRFIEEAQIEGQLQHPGVVPVYGLGVQPDGRPYFAMKLVKGDTLDSLLKGRRKLKENRGRLLQIFEQVCQTVAYAHARRVIHRDLKPANILVGAYGQVQVVDWGFAKVLRRGGIADEAREPRHDPSTSLIETIRSSKHGSKSIAGSVMGTPAYMPPEQAHGHVANVDETSDVFALGGILAEILTGRPTYAGSTASEVLRKAIDGDTSPARARLKKCGADPEIVKIAKRCLMPAQAARPRNASEVANAVREYLSGVEDRAHKAEVEAAKARVREEGERRAKRLTLGLAAAILLGVLGGGAGFWRADRAERERTARAAQTVGTALEEVSLALGRAREAGATRMDVWPEALTAAEQAVSLAEKVEAPEDVLARAVAIRDTAVEEHDEARREADQMANEQEMLARLRDVRDYRWVLPTGMLSPSELTQEAARFVDAFRVGGIDWDYPRKAAARVRASRHRDQLILTLDTWRHFLIACDLGTTPVDRFLERADPDPLRSQIRAAAAVKDAHALRGPLIDPGLRELPTLTLALLSEALLQVDERTAALEASRAWQTLSPNDVDANLGLGRLLLCQESLTALHYKEAALSLTRAVAQHPRGLAARYFLAMALVGTQRVDEAIQAMRDALALAPEERSLNLYYGTLLTARAGNHAKAELHQMAYEAQRQAVEAWEKADPPREMSAEASSIMYHYLAVYAQMLQRWPEVLRAAQRAVELNPNPAPATLETLAMAQIWHGDIDEAMKTLDGVEAQDHVCPRALMIRGCALTNLGRLEEALSYVDRIEGLELEHGDLPDANLASYKAQVAWILDALGRYDDAEDELRDCIDLAKDKSGYPAQLARVLRHAGRHGAALREGEFAIERQLSFLETLQPNTPAQLQAAFMWGSLAGRVDSLAQARKRFLRSFPGRPGDLYGMYLAGVGNALVIFQANATDARAAVAESLNLLPRCVPALQCLAWLKSYAGDDDGALRTMRKAGEYRGSLDAIAYLWANLCLQAGRLDEIRPLLEDGEWSEWLRKNYKPYLDLDRRVDGYLRGHWQPLPKDRGRLAYLLLRRGENRKALALIEETLADGPPEDGTPYGKVMYRLSACTNAAAAAAALAADVSLPSDERSRWRREGAAWVRRVTQYQEEAVTYFNLFVPDPRPQQLAFLLVDHQFAPIRDEDAMADASEEDKAICRQAWAEYRALYDRVR